MKVDYVDTHGVYLQRGVFSTPLDISDDVFRKTYPYYAQRFIDAMEKQGWSLKSELDWGINLANPDTSRKHFYIRGWFVPKFQAQEVIYDGLTEEMAKKIIKKMPKKARILTKGRVV